MSTIIIIIIIILILIIMIAPIEHLSIVLSHLSTPTLPFLLRLSRPCLDQHR